MNFTALSCGALLSCIKSLLQIVEPRTYLADIYIYIYTALPVNQNIELQEGEQQQRLLVID